MLIIGGITMKSTGIVRKVDELGRVVIPIEIRNKFDIAEASPHPGYRRKRCS